MHSLDAPYGETGGAWHPLMVVPSQHSVLLWASWPAQPHIHLGREDPQGPMGSPRVLDGLGREGKAGISPGRRTGWVCGQEAVKHSEVREVPETGAQLGG